MEQAATDVASSDSDSGTQDVDTDTVTHFGVGAQAEDYDAIEAQNSGRAWYLITTETAPDLVDPDDNSHAKTAHGGAYLEFLPDLFAFENDPNDDGFGFASDPFEGAEVGFFVNLEATGRYYVWVRGYTTGGKDNTLFVGIDGTWPASVDILQFPSNAHAWVWSSNQRNSGGKLYGIPLTIYLDVETSGEHIIAFAIGRGRF